MNTDNFIISLHELIHTRLLSARTQTCFFSKYQLPAFRKKYGKNGIEYLGQYVKELRSGEYIAQSEYSLIETNYVYVSVNNFSKGEVDLSDLVFLNDEIGEEYSKIKIDEGDLIITRSGTVGSVALFEVPSELSDKIFIPSHHLAIIKTSNPNDNLFLKYYLSSPFCKEFFESYATGKVQKEITNWSIKKIPIPLNVNKKKMVEKFKMIENKIAEKKQKMKSLQDIISVTLKKYKIKSNTFNDFSSEVLNINLTEVGLNKGIRLSSNYHSFWKNHGGYLFEGTDNTYEVLPLKRILFPATRTNLKKGPLSEPRILIDFEQVEARHGKIKDYDNWVSEIGSNKLVFGDCDLLTNKLRPYLGYTILNEPELNLIGTTEFLPFKVKDKEKVSKEYIRYLLLSSEYLQKSVFLMGGKEHPRIQLLDFLNIKVPLPNRKIQDEIVTEIKEQYEQSMVIQTEIEQLKKEINSILQEELERIAL